MLTPRAVVLHLTILIVVPLFAALCDWQVHRALSGNSLSWAYVFEWPFFAGYAVYLWWKLLHEPPVPDGEAVTSPSGVDGQRASGRAVEMARPEGVPAEAGGALGVAAGVGPAGDVSGNGGRRPPSSGKATSEEEQEEREAEELAAYNRYLAELDATHARKAW